MTQSKLKFKPQKEEEVELGFGKKNYTKNIHFFNKNGSINIKRKGLGILNNTDIYHWLVTAPLSKLLITIFSVYIFVNATFASIYYWLGADNFGGIHGTTEWDKFLSLFFFSSQTLTTLGYGYTYPKAHLVSLVASVESLLGLIAFAIAAGIVYSRFSRPKSDLLYSKNCLIAPYKDETALMFRVANKMQYELIENEAHVICSYNNQETGKRAFANLKLELDKIDFLALSWTLVHHINEKSPLLGWTEKDFVENDVEIIILIKSINDTFSQSVHSRYSYLGTDVVENAKFKPLATEPDENGTITIDVTEINHYIKT